jgi:hypothetical protein
MRRFISLLFIPMCFMAGCANHIPATGADLVTIPQLGAATANLSYFDYVGSDAGYHYFLTDDGTQYCIRLSNWTPPQTLPHTGKFISYVTVKDGKLTVRDVQEPMFGTDDTMPPPPAVVAPSSPRPQTRRDLTVEDFRKLRADMTIEEVFVQLGRPTADEGSGEDILRYILADGSSVFVHSGGAGGGKGIAVDHDGDDLLKSNESRSTSQPSH